MPEFVSICYFTINFVLTYMPRLCGPCYFDEAVLMKLFEFTLITAIRKQRSSKPQ